jgi:nitrogen regulatory protein PII
MYWLAKITQNVQKVEIIIDNYYLQEVLNLLDKIEVSGYTLFNRTSGKGDRGESCDDFYCNFQSAYILTVCTNEEQLFSLQEMLKPLLTKVGGICLVTSAQWIKH